MRFWPRIFPQHCPPEYRHPHIHWSFGGHLYTSPLGGKFGDFRYWIDLNTEQKTSLSFREEMFAAAQEMDLRRKGKTIALCYSGGIDSESIALTLNQLGIPFELYFLDIWGLNRRHFEEWARPFLAKLGKEPHIISANRTHCYEQIFPSLFGEFGCEFPTYLALAHLFEQIPSEQFILVGDGDMHRSGPLFKQIAQRQPQPPSSNPLPFSTASVFYYLWAASRNRAGEFYFFSSRPSLISAMLNDPHFKLEYPFGDTREAIYAAFPEIARRPKTTNWDGDAYQENVWIRSWLANYAKKLKGFQSWREGMGA